MHRGEWCDPEAVHTGRPVPQPLLAVFAALGEPGGEAGNHVPHLLRAAAALALAECRRPAPPAGKAAATFDRVRTFLDYNYTRPIGRGELAERFGLNANYLSELFRRMGGCGVQEYIEARRFDMARAAASHDGAAGEDGRGALRLLRRGLLHPPLPGIARPSPRAVTGSNKIRDFLIRTVDKSRMACHI